MRDFTGIQVGRYTVKECVDRGGNGLVYKALDNTLGVDVAIKLIRIDDIPIQQLDRVRERFRVEARKMAELSHSHVMHVTDYGEYNGVPFLVMPLMTGGSLKKYVGKQINWRQAVKLIEPVAEALAYTHSKGIIHRDVKPSNILLTEMGEPMLTDFGIVKIVDVEKARQLTLTGTLVGTPEYMAPEQYTTTTFDHRVDIYALGIVLYELITGQKPFTGDTTPEIMIKHARDPLPKPKSFVPNLPDEVEFLLVKALAKEPKDRYADMSEFAQALESLLDKKTAANEEKIISRIAAEEKTTDNLPVGYQGSKAPRRVIPTQAPVAGGGKTKPTSILWVPIGLGTLVLLTITVVLISQKDKSVAPGSSASKAPVQVTQTARIQPTSTRIPAAPSPNLGIGGTIISEKDGMTLVYVPEGEFVMGSEDEYDRSPVHTVYLDAYWIDRTEVTNAQYQKCVEAGACTPPISTSSDTRDSYFGSSAYSDYPVIYVNWNQAHDYCQWAGRRLPTEAEWEKAARGTDGRIYPWGNEVPNSTLLNFNGNEGDITKVGNYPQGASPYGALDMAGNVWEWVADWYDAGYYSQSPGSNPGGPASGEYRGLRGGSWRDGVDFARSASREWMDPSSSFDVVGFRCAREVK